MKNKILISLLAFVAIFSCTVSLSACGENNDGDDGTDFEAADILGIYELGENFDLLLDDETSAALFAKTENRQFAGEWSLDEDTINATFTEDVTPQPSTADNYALTAFAEITATVNIADSGRITLTVITFKFNQTAQSVTEATTPYEPVKGLIEWSDLIGTYNCTPGGGVVSKLIINESGYFSMNSKFPFDFSQTTGKKGTANGTTTGKGVLGDNNTLTLEPYTTSAVYYNNDGTKSSYYSTNDEPAVFTIDRSSNTIKLIYPLNGYTYIKQ